MANSLSSSQIALTLMQQAVVHLAQWSESELVLEINPSSEIQAAKQHLYWPENKGLQPLRSLFDSIQLSENNNSQRHYWQPQKLADSHPIIPYPIAAENPSEKFAGAIDCLKQQIREELAFLADNREDWQNLSLLTLIVEKFGSFLSFGEPDVALIDKARITAALATAIAGQTEPYHLSLIVGDLSGIQDFIYTISSDGALKSLRARSFYLELVTEEVVQQLLKALDLPRVNVIYAGGGNLYILAPGIKKTQEITRQIRIQFNAWLLNKFQGKVYLALDSSDPFPLADIANRNFAEHWTKATKKLAVYKSRKFGDRLEDIQSLLTLHRAYTPCGVCHRDDEPNLKPLNQDSEVQACSTCREMYKLGRILFKVEVIVRSSSPSTDQNPITIELPNTEDRSTDRIYYHLFDNWKQIVPRSDTALLVNDWNLEHYRFQNFKNSLPLLLGNYPQEKPTDPEDDNFMSASEMAEKSQGIKRMGYLRMDVDRLGQIFARGLSNNQDDGEGSAYLPRLASLSRQMSYFFKVYLNSLAADREKNTPHNIKNLLSQKRSSATSPNGETTTENLGRILLFIYAGGDDLFISGAWNEIGDFAFDVYQCFRSYTGYNRDITLSGGVSIADAKFPLYQAAEESGDAEEKAKSNGRDSLGLFGEVFKWDEWLGMDNTGIFSSEIRDYLGEQPPSLLGILPFVNRLEQEKIDTDYPRSFVRNLLLTAQIQQQELKKFKKTEQHSEEAMGTRYYLYLPKVVYTLSRLPKEVLKDEQFRQSLKNPYNAPYFQAIATWLELLNRAE